MKILKDIFNPVRILTTAFFLSILIIIGFLIYLMVGVPEEDPNLEFGITFSQINADKIGIKWQKAYLEILDDLKVRKIRLIAYWPLIEPQEGNYSFSDLDWQIDEAKKRNTEIILAAGISLPGWSDYYIPEWAKELSDQEKKEKALLYIEQVVDRYNKEEAIKTWQIENAPFQLDKEEISLIDYNFLNKEISLVRENDFLMRPIMVTVKGDLSCWLKPANMSDKLGIAIYRNDWNKILSNVNLPIRPVFYKKMSNLVKRFTNVDNIVIIDLQGEPRGSRPVYEMSSIEWQRSMSLENFEKTINYAKGTGFAQVYFTGAEWWNYLKDNNQPLFWEKAKEIWSQ